MAKEKEKMFFLFSWEDNQEIIKALNHFNVGNNKFLSRQKFLIHLAKEYVKQNKI